MHPTTFFCLIAFILATNPLNSIASDLPAVLTDNATGEEPSIETGVQYSAEPAFTNPADNMTGVKEDDPDATGRRLLDRDLPCADWTTCVGVNTPEQTVTFDFQGRYRFTKFALLFRLPEKPATVECSVADSPDGPWSSVGTLTPEDRWNGLIPSTPISALGPEDGWNELKPAAPVTGRYVRMSFQIKEWGWYLSEVKVWGLPASEHKVGR